VRPSPSSSASGLQASYRALAAERLRREQTTRVFCPRDETDLTTAAAPAAPTPSRWGPFSHLAFTVIWTASLVSNVGTAMFEVDPDFGTGVKLSWRTASV
jgi:hypothetical protein